MTSGTQNYVSRSPALFVFFVVVHGSFDRSEGSLHGSTEASMEIFLPDASTKTSAEASMEAASVEASMKASVEATFMEVSTEAIFMVNYVLS